MSITNEMEDTLLRIRCRGWRISTYGDGTTAVWEVERKGTMLSTASTSDELALLHLLDQVLKLDQLMVLVGCTFDSNSGWGMTFSPDSQ